MATKNQWREHIDKVAVLSAQEIVDYVERWLPDEEEADICYEKVRRAVHRACEPLWTRLIEAGEIGGS